MRDQVFGDHLDALVRTDQGFDRRPFLLQPLLFGRGLVLGQFLDLCIDHRLHVIRQFNAR